MLRPIDQAIADRRTYESENTAGRQIDAAPGHRADDCHGRFYYLSLIGALHYVPRTQVSEYSSNFGDGKECSVSRHAILLPCKLDSGIPAADGLQTLHSLPKC